MAEEIISLKVETKKVRCEVTINGIPIVMFTSGEAADNITIPINQYLINGNNVFVFILHAGATPGTVTKAWESSPLAKDYHGDDSINIECIKNNTLYFKETWNGSLTPRPLIIKKTLPLHLSYPSEWMWYKQAQTLEDKHIKIGFDYLKVLYNMINNGNSEKFTAENKIKFDEHEEAYDVGMKGMKKSMKSVINYHYSSDKYELLSLNFSELDYRFIAGKKMLEFRRKDWGHAIQFNHVEFKEDHFFLPLSLGIINNEWYILQ